MCNLRINVGLTKADDRGKCKKVSGFRQWTDFRGKGGPQEERRPGRLQRPREFGRNLVSSHDDEQESFPNWSGRRADTLLLDVDAILSSNAR